MQEAVAAGEAPSGSDSTALPAKKSARDNRVDLVRGFALAVIFVNHMPGNWIGEWTPRNFGFSDAAEMFVMLAGFAAAMAYSGLAARGDTRGLIGKALRRAGVLYGAHILTTLAAFGLFWSVMAITRSPMDLDLIGMAPIITDPSTSLLALLIGGFQLSYFNILPLYVVLLCALPLMLLLAIKDMRLLALVSATAWLATNVSGVSLPRMADYDSWFFNPIAWQALFAIGLTIGMYHLKGKHVRYNGIAYVVALGYLAFAAWWRVAGPGGDLMEDTLPASIGSLQKPNLPLARLAHVGALAYVVAHSPLWRWLGQVPRGFVLTRMGRHSLPVFISGSLLSMSGWLISAEAGGGKLVETIVAALGIALMSALALHLEGSLNVPSLPAGGRKLQLIPARATARVIVRQRRRHSRIAR